MVKFWGIYYTAGTAPVLCEVDGGVCFSASRSPEGAQAEIECMAERLRRNYDVRPLPVGTLCNDPLTGATVMAG